MTRFVPIVYAALFFCALGGLSIYRGLHPDPSDASAVQDANAHPIAVAAGSAAPALIGSIGIFFWARWWVRRRLK